MNELEAKKKALVAESEVYRQTLKLEIQNLRLCAIRARRKLTLLEAASSLLMPGAPLAAGLLSPGRRSPSFMRYLKIAFMGWRLYRKAAPLIGTFFPGQKRTRESRAENRAPAANI